MTFQEKTIILRFDSVEICCCGECKFVKWHDSKKLCHFNNEEGFKLDKIGRNGDELDSIGFLLVIFAVETVELVVDGELTVEKGDFDIITEMT